MTPTKFLSGLIGATLLTTTAAFAQGDYYVHGTVGLNTLLDTDQEGAPGTVATEYDSGAGVSIAVGKALPSWGSARAEVELSYADNDVDTLDFSGNGAGAENTVGGVTTTSLRANVLYDFAIAGSPFTPYVGVGAGVSLVDSDIAYGAAPVIIEDDTTVFSAQLIAGTSYDLSDTTALTLDARYSRAFGVELDRVSPAGTAVVEDDFDNLSVNVGVRFKF